MNINELLAEYEHITESAAEELYAKAVQCVLENGTASRGFLTAKTGIGDHKARAFLHRMESDGIIGPYRPGQAREVLYKKK